MSIVVAVCAMLHWSCLKASTVTSRSRWLHVYAHICTCNCIGSLILCVHPVSSHTHTNLIPLLPPLPLFDLSIPSPPSADSSHSPWLVLPPSSLMKTSPCLKNGFVGQPRCPLLRPTPQSPYKRSSSLPAPKGRGKRRTNPHRSRRAGPRAWHPNKGVM